MNILAVGACCYAATRIGLFGVTTLKLDDKTNHMWNAIEVDRKMLVDTVKIQCNGGYYKEHNSIYPIVIVDHRTKLPS